MIDSRTLFRKVTPSVLETDADPVSVSDAAITGLIVAAREAPNGRARLILHEGADDNFHEMVIALPSTSCDHPHINFKSGKSFLALSGQFAVMRFSDDGAEIEAIVLSDGRYPGARMTRLRRAAWHTIIPLEGDTVFLESIAGPFEGNRFAAWFPETSHYEKRADFVDRLRRIARRAAEALP
jgi:cupin fold WbuC family metalloprotein